MIRCVFSGVSFVPNTNPNNTYRYDHVVSVETGLAVTCAAELHVLLAVQPFGSVLAVCAPHVPPPAVAVLSSAVAKCASSGGASGVARLAGDAVPQMLAAMQTMPLPWFLAEPQPPPPIATGRGVVLFRVGFFVSLGLVRHSIL